MGELPRKEDVAQALLLRGSVFVHLDPRLEGVALPEHLRCQPQVMLQIGLDLDVAIPDLRVGSRGIQGTLRFSREPFECRIPWAAVFALSGEDGRGMVWEDSFPAEVSAELDREMGRRSPAGLRVVSSGHSERPPRPRRDSSTSSLLETDDPIDAPEPREAPARKTRTLPSYLRVVK